jgi:hypothetical protein
MSTTSKRLLLAAAVAVTAITACVGTPFAQNNDGSGVGSAYQQSTGAQITANPDPAITQAAHQKAQAAMTAARASVPQTEANRNAAAAMRKATADATSKEAASSK